MPTKNHLITGLDIGTTSIKVVIAELQQDPDNGDKVNVIGVGKAPSKGLRKGVVINIDGTVSSIEAAIAQAEAMAGCEVSSVFASISGAHIKGFNSHGIVGIKGREVSQSDIDKVLDAARAVAIPMDREVLHVLPEEYIIDDQDGIKQPLGISGVRLEAKVHMVTGAVASGQNIVKCANRCGLAVHDIVIAPIASGKAVVTEEEKELGVGLVDVGGGTCDLTIYHGGAVRHSQVLPVGGNHITNDIAAGLRTPISAADEIKCRYGTALSSLVGQDETIEVPSTGGRPSRILSKLVLAEIIEPRCIEICNLVHREVMRAECEELLTSGLVLTGGTANLVGISGVAEKVFNLPVRVAKPFGVGGLEDLVASAEYATAIGLLKYAVSDFGYARFTSGGSKVRRVAKQVGSWLRDHF